MRLAALTAGHPVRMVGRSRFLLCFSHPEGCLHLAGEEIQGRLVTALTRGFRLNGPGRGLWAREPGWQTGGEPTGRHRRPPAV